MVKNILMDEGLLKKLALDCSDSFLSVKKKSGDPLEKVISLYGADNEILTKVKNQMEMYFQDKGEEIQINLSNCGYKINIGYLLVINKSLREA